MIRKTAVFFLAVFAVGCAVLPGVQREYEVGYTEKGVASWYGEPFHGRATANGEIYDMNGLTAAHRLLPLGSTIRVTNLDNGRSVTVRVNDRGPFVRGRMLDLSYGAAQALNMVRDGTGRVKIRVLQLPGNRNSSYTVQVGAFSDRQNASRLSADLSDRYSDVSVELSGNGPNPSFRVWVGVFENERQAEKTARKLQHREGVEAFVTRRE
jgi:peptidoglycan lytic transglycosylase